MFEDDPTTQSKAIKATLLRLLSQRDYSRYELAFKLSLKGFNDDASNPILDEFVEKGYINDQRFTENFIRWQQQKGYGPYWIRFALESRGIASEIIAEQLDMTDNAWFIHARKVWQKHFKNNLPVDPKICAKQIRFLTARGFTKAHIESIFKA